MDLLSVPIGRSCHLKIVEMTSASYDRFMELGFTRGEMITVVRRAPLGGPLHVRIRGADFAISSSDAKCVKVSA